jgi:DNA repair exonuclease SbcCD ATPase subunit
MKQNRAEKKARMMTRLEKVVDELLNWEEANEKPNLTEIEDIVLRLRKQVGEDMVDEVLGEMSEKTPVPGPACPRCGKEMRYKGQRERHLEARVGGVEYERGYYACGECDEGIFPPGSTTWGAG